MEEYEQTNLYSPGEELLLPRLPRSLPFDELVFIIENRITEIIELPYSLEQVHGSPFYVSVIRPIVASLILPYDEDYEESNTEFGFYETPSSPAANLRASHNRNSAKPAKTYTFTDQHRGIVAALLVARLEFLDGAADGGRFAKHQKSLNDDLMFKERGVLEARAYTAELVAIKFLSFMTLEMDRIEFLTYEYNSDQDEENEPSAEIAPSADVSQDILQNNTRLKSMLGSSRSMVQFPLVSNSSHRATSPHTRPPVPIRKPGGAFFNFSNSLDDRNRNPLHFSDSFDKTFKSPASSITESSPLLSTSPGNSKYFETSFTEPLLSAATNPALRRSFTEPSSPKEWGSSLHDRLIEHGLFIEQYADQSALDLALAGSQPAREFISSDAVQSIATRIWSGRIMYWKTIEADAQKTIHLYNPVELVDYYSRLKVPRYRSFFMMINYSILMILFHVLLFQKHKSGTDALIECFLNIWFIGFVLDEVSQAREAGSFGQYFADFWAFFDLCIVGVFIMFAGLRVLGIVFDNEQYTQLSFDILSLEAVLLVPRLFSFLSIFPYFGTLLPCLRELTVEFFKFLVIIAIIYVGFLASFSFLGRNTFTFDQMSWLLIRVFFGSSYAGFDAAPLISPIFGPPLMLIFVTLTNILLVTVLISILSQKFSTIMLNARQEYAIHFLATVLDSVNASGRVTYFYPPLNIIGVLLRPFRLVLDQKQYRAFRIRVLKATHWPFVAMVWAFEYATMGVRRRRVQRYMKIRRDRRLSVARRVTLHHHQNPFLDDDYGGSSSDNPNGSDDDIERLAFLRTRNRANGAPRKSFTVPSSGDTDRGKGDSSALGKRRIWKRSETLFPRFKRFPKRLKRYQTASPAVMNSTAAASSSAGQGNWTNNNVGGHGP